MKTLPELLYNLAGLAVVVACAYFFFWGFLVVVGTSVIVSLVLMTVERFIA